MNQYNTLSNPMVPPEFHVPVTNIAAEDFTPSFRVSGVRANADGTVVLELNGVEAPYVMKQGELVPGHFTKVISSGTTLTGANEILVVGY